LREEGDVAEVGDDVPGGLEPPSVYIDGVTDGLEGVEADADGKDDIQRPDLGRVSEEGEGGHEVFEEEVGILEIAEDAQVHSDTEPEEGFPYPAGLHAKC
jgi:hypothetical protein